MEEVRTQILHELSEMDFWDPNFPESVDMEDGSYMVVIYPETPNAKPARFDVSDGEIVKIHESLLWYHVTPQMISWHITTSFGSNPLNSLIELDRFEAGTNFLRGVAARHKELKKRSLFEDDDFCSGIDYMFDALGMSICPEGATDGQWLEYIITCIGDGYYPWDHFKDLSEIL